MKYKIDGVCARSEANYEWALKHLDNVHIPVAWSEQVERASMRRQCRCPLAAEPFTDAIPDEDIS